MSLLQFESKAVDDTEEIFGLCAEHTRDSELCGVLATLNRELKNKVNEFSFYQKVKNLNNNIIKEKFNDFLNVLQKKDKLSEEFFKMLIKKCQNESQSEDEFIIICEVLDNFFIPENYDYFRNTPSKTFIDIYNQKFETLYHGQTSVHIALHVIVMFWVSSLFKDVTRQRIKKSQELLHYIKTEVEKIIDEQKKLHNFRQSHIIIDTIDEEISEEKSNFEDGQTYWVKLFPNVDFTA